MAQEKKYTGKSKKQSSDVLEELNTLLGKIPPQSPELEKSVLGALLIQSSAIYDVSNILQPESFYINAHQVIYETMKELMRSEKPIDTISVAEELKKKNQLDEIGGIPYLIELTELVGSAAHIEYHARIVQQKYIQRELIKTATEIQKFSYDETKDVEELIGYAEGEIFKISEGMVKRDVVKLGDVVTTAMETLNTKASDKESTIGVLTGFHKLDNITSGWQPSDLIIIAARPSMGKTAFVLSMARNMVVDYRKPVAFFSLEMSALQIANRLLSAESKVPAQSFRNGNITKEDWKNIEIANNTLIGAPLFIDDTPALSIFELRAKCRRLARSKEGLSAVIIDYLQLMTSGVDNKGSREQEVSTISRTLKAIAKELNVPIIALSQLNRSVETRGNDKRPQLSDLRESGAIEQDADIVAFIHRPWYYGIKFNENNESTENKATIIIAKHRNGGLDDVELDFIQEYAKFENPSSINDSNDNDNTYNNGSYQIHASKMNSKSYSDDRNGLDNSTIIGKEDFLDSTTDFSAQKEEQAPF